MPCVSLKSFWIGLHQFIILKMQWNIEIVLCHTVKQNMSYGKTLNFKRNKINTLFVYMVHENNGGELVWYIYIYT